MILHPKEIENILKLSPLERYQYFIRKTADFEEFYTIVNIDGDIALSSIEENIIVSVWTAKYFIKGNLTGEWKDCLPKRVDLDYFEENMMPIIQKNNYLINVFSINGHTGFVVNLEEFIRDLNEELSKYI